ncbi:DNA-binding response regulator, OmpR family, contains REC and winged-helix (wHTH) domain [Apibacter mensalis]|uniref:DNA-binding response regulator, OmpR family, contains REC and winged-helix (WHTH) domain n=1 Tax=Apibacter mensalis TaxID=1586267 RepID=A0A0X3AMH5_9FLAO|nr:response regulator transcription factor [Apibacter mensalis]CVK15572.1 DNA-binding response regulator, OmpR family, contains REC and winged-helix (wHTH) domain [Apibacter mensalis]
MELLLVEDNKKISEFMIQGLEESGFSVTLVENGVDARSRLNDTNWNIILLDIMLPDIDGMELLQYIRYKKITTPVLVISALGDPDDKVKALSYGADDYLTKPFHFKELVARIHALDRRRKMNYESSSEVLVCGDLKMYLDEHKILRKDKEIILTHLEFKLLKFLIENKNKVVSRTQILISVWGINHHINTNIVDVYISYLRNKIDGEFETKIIETIKGRGYRIKSL